MSTLGPLLPPTLQSAFQKHAARPPFRLIGDIVAHLLPDYPPATPDAKQEWIANLIAYVEMTGKVEPKKVVAGMEAEKTVEMLEAVARADRKSQGKTTTQTQDQSTKPVSRPPTVASSPTKAEPSTSQPVSPRRPDSAVRKSDSPTKTRPESAQKTESKGRPDSAKAVEKTNKRPDSAKKVETKARPDSAKPTNRPASGQQQKTDKDSPNSPVASISSSPTKRPESSMASQSKSGTSSPTKKIVKVEGSPMSAARPASSKAARPQPIPKELSIPLKTQPLENSLSSPPEPKPDEAVDETVHSPVDAIEVKRARPMTANKAPPKIRAPEQLISPLPVTPSTIPSQVTESDANDFFSLAETTEAPTLSTDEGKQHGALVRSLLEERRETAPELQDLSASPTKQNDRREIATIRDSLQTFVTNLNPLRKLLDYLPEDLDAMNREYHHWTKEASKWEEVARRLDQQPDPELVALFEELNNTESSIAELEVNILEMRSALLEGDRRITKLVNGLVRINR